jgi:ketosteroid isomerase-like protein
MHTHHFVAISLLLVLLHGCRADGPPVITANQADSAVRSLLAVQDSVASAEDLEGFLQLVAEDAVFLPPGEVPLEGKPAIRAWYESFFKAFDVQLEHIPGPVEVKGDVIIHRGVARGTLRPRAGGAPVSFDNKYLFAMRVDPDRSVRHWRAMFNANATAASR